MKRLFTGIIALMYLAISSGFVLNVHYCMGKVSGVDVDNFSKAICSCSKQEKPGACCTSKFKLVKLEDVHKAPVWFSNLQVPALLPLPNSFLSVPFIPSVPLNAADAHAPPGEQNNLYIRNCVFRV